LDPVEIILSAMSDKIMWPNHYIASSLVFPYIVLLFLKVNIN